VGGTWKDPHTDNVNFMASNLTGQVRNIADVATAIARGDLSKKITVRRAWRELLQLKRQPSTQWSNQLSALLPRVTRVAREVVTEASSAGRRRCPASPAAWKDLTDNGQARWPRTSLDRFSKYRRG